MRLALHIFRKDVRHLWPQIVVALVLVVGHAILDVLQTPAWRPGIERINALAGLTSFLLPLAWWSLIAALIYEEMLPGDRQFWVTRPYSWATLLAAKVLFILAFVNLPLLVSDCFILGAQGFPVVSNLPDLLLREPLVSSWLILPAFALSAVTSGMGQFVLTGLAVITGIITESLVLRSAGPGSSIDFISLGGWGAAVLLLAIIATIPWQYRKRRTQAARFMLAFVVFAVVPGLSLIPGARGSTAELKSQGVDASRVRISYDLARVPSPINIDRWGPGTTTLLLPLRVSGLPPNTALVTRGEEVSIEPKIDDVSMAGAVQRKGADYVEAIYLDPSRLQAIRSHRVSLRAKLRLTLVTDGLTTKVPVWQTPIPVAGIGVCDAYTGAGGAEGPQLVCRAGVHPAAAALVWLEYPQYRSEPVQWGQVTSGYNLFWGLSPVEKWVIRLSNLGASSSEIRIAMDKPGAELRFTVQRPLSDLTRELNLSDVDLAPFLVQH